MRVDSPVRGSMLQPSLRCCAMERASRTVQLQALRPQCLSQRSRSARKRERATPPRNAAAMSTLSWLCCRLTGTRRGVQCVWTRPLRGTACCRQACVAAPCSVLAALCCCVNCAAQCSRTLAQCSGMGAPHQGCHTAAEGMQPWPHYPLVSQAVWNVQRRAVRVDSPTARHSMLQAACVAAPCSVLAALCCCVNCAHSALARSRSALEWERRIRDATSQQKACSHRLHYRCVARLSGTCRGVQCVCTRPLRGTACCRQPALLRHAACLSRTVLLRQLRAQCSARSRSALEWERRIRDATPQQNACSHGRIPRLCPRLSGTCRGVQCVWTRPLRGTACCRQPALLRHAAC